MLHPVQIAVVEAELRIALPMSAADLHEILGREWPLGTVAYHVRRLAAAGVLVERYREPRRGSAECFYLLAS